MKSAYLDEAVLRGLSLNQKLLERFPFLKEIGDSISGMSKCGACGGGRTARIAAAYSSAKREIATMVATEQAALLAYLDLDQLTVVYPTTEGGPTETAILVKSTEQG